MEYLVIAFLCAFVAREISFFKKEKFYLDKIDTMTNKIMSRDYDSYMFATKKDWSAKEPPKQENYLMEDMGPVQSFL